MVAEIDIQHRRTGPQHGADTARRLEIEPGTYMMNELIGIGKILGMAVILIHQIVSILTRQTHDNTAIEGGTVGQRIRPAQILDSIGDRTLQPLSGCIELLGRDIGIVGFILLYYLKSIKLLYRQFHSRKRVAIVVVDGNTDIAGIDNHLTRIVLQHIFIRRESIILQHMKLRKETARRPGARLRVDDATQIAVVGIGKHRIGSDGPRMNKVSSLRSGHLVEIGHDVCSDKGRTVVA